MYEAGAVTPDLAKNKVMAYGSQLKTMYDAFTGAAENLGTANLPKFAYDLHGNMNDFARFCIHKGETLQTSQ